MSHIDGDIYPIQDDFIGVTGDVVLYLCFTVPKDKASFVCVDWFYTSLDLTRCLRQEKILTVVTVMGN